MRAVRWRAGVVAGLCAVVVPATAHAVPPCTGAGTAVTPILRGQGTLESVIVDARGRLFYTDLTLGVLRRIDAPGEQPTTIATIPEPGGLAIDDVGRILVGSGDGLATGAVGNLMPSASLMRVAPDGGPVEVVARGLQMANGIVRAADGTVYASSDVGLGVDRVAPDGKVTVRWTTVISSNGLAIDRAQRYLYAAQTFTPAAIARIDLRDPSKVQTFATPEFDDMAAGPDGMTIDGKDRLYVAAQIPGAIWRVDTDRRVCAVATGLKNPSAVAFGHGERGFSEGRLFSVGFDGTLAELPGGRLPATTTPPASRAVRFVFEPRTARVRGGRVRIRPRVFSVSADGTRRRRAVRVTIGGRRGRTGDVLTIPVEPHARTLSAAFTARGHRRTRTIRLLRG
jgi:sugar lactone lactonase YvrE